MLGAHEFAKYHALGNDYLVLDGDGTETPSAPRIRLLCHRNLGVGSDGILLKVPSRRAHLGLRIFNPDGSEAEKSGNGLRIFARCMFDLGYVSAHAFTIETPGGLVQARLTVQDGVVQAIQVDMGVAQFSSGAVGLMGPEREAVGEFLQVGPERLAITAVSMGNPHCVHFVPSLDVQTLRRLGPLIENHPAFPGVPMCNLFRWCIDNVWIFSFGSAAPVKPWPRAQVAARRRRRPVKPISWTRTSWCTCPAAPCRWTWMTPLRCA